MPEQEAVARGGLAFLLSTMSTTMGMHIHTPADRAPVRSISALAAYVLPPLLPLFLSCYLLLRHARARHARAIRASLAGLGTLAAVHSFARYRFTGAAEILNIPATIYLQTLIFKLAEAAAMRGLYEPWVVRGRKAPVAAVDLALNARMLFLDMDTDHTSSLSPEYAGRPLSAGALSFHPHSANARLAQAEYARVEQQGNLPPVPPLHPRYAHRYWLLRWNDGLLVRVPFHLGLASALLSGDGCLGLFRRFPQLQYTALAQGAPAHVRGDFVQHTRFALLGAVVLPALFTDLVLKSVIGIAIVCAMSGGYHLAAALALASGLWEEEAWAVSLFGPFWSSSSLHQLWGHDLHQLTALLRLLPLPASVAPTLHVLLTFALLAAMYSLATMSIPSLDPAGIATYFLLCAAGILAERAFCNITGRRVRGPLGALWTWSFIAAASGPAVDALLDAGLAGCAGRIPWGDAPTDRLNGVLGYVFQPLEVA